jgi:23S rRNA pseudouridine1911/1915/1917 synthase
MNTITYQDSTTQRVDKYLAEKYPAFSRRYFQDGLKTGKVLINGHKKSPSYKLKNNDRIEIKLSLTPPTKITKLPANKKVPIDIVAKYPDFLIINKPAGLTVHPSVFDIQNNSLPPTLAGGLIAKFPELQNIGEDFSRPAIVHRLDKDTSGLMIIPRTQQSFRKFKKMFQNHSITKTYLALCWHSQRQINSDKKQTGKKYKVIENFIGKSKSDHTKQATNKNPAYLINPKQAKTLYKIIQQTKLPCLYKVGKIKKQEKEISLVQVQPQTGRKHQVRVHLSSVGLPLVGDHKYTNRLLKNCNKNFSQHLLQAHKLEFTYQGQKYSFTAPEPEWFNLMQNNRH